MSTHKPLPAEEVEATLLRLVNAAEAAGCRFIRKDEIADSVGGIDVPLPRGRQAVALFQSVYVLRPARMRLQREERVHKMRLHGQRRPPSGLDDARRDEAYAHLREALNPLRKAQQLLAQDAAHAREDLGGLRAEYGWTPQGEWSGRLDGIVGGVEALLASMRYGGPSGATPEADGEDAALAPNGLAVDAATVRDLDEISFEIPDLALGFQPRDIAHAGEWNAARREVASLLVGAGFTHAEIAWLLHGDDELPTVRRIEQLLRRARQGSEGQGSTG